MKRPASLRSLRVHATSCALVLAAACGGPSPAPAPGQQPIKDVPAAPSCIDPDTPNADVRLAGGVLVACFPAPQPGGGRFDDCWHFDLATSAWRFGARRPHVDAAPRQPTVNATAT